MRRAWSRPASVSAEIDEGAIGMSVGFRDMSEKGRRSESQPPAEQGESRDALLGSGEPRGSSKVEGATPPTVTPVAKAKLLVSSTGDSGSSKQTPPAGEKPKQ